MNTDKEEEKCLLIKKSEYDKLLENNKDKRIELRWDYAYNRNNTQNILHPALHIYGDFYLSDGIKGKISSICNYIKDSFNKRMIIQDNLVKDFKIAESNRLSDKFSKLSLFKRVFYKKKYIL